MLINSCLFCQEMQLLLCPLLAPHGSRMEANRTGQSLTVHSCNAFWYLFQWICWIFWVTPSPRTECTFCTEKIIQQVGESDLIPASVNVCIFPVNSLHLMCVWRVARGACIQYRGISDCVQLSLTYLPSTGQVFCKVHWGSYTYMCSFDAPNCDCKHFLIYIWQYRTLK